MEGLSLCQVLSRSLGGLSSGVYCWKAVGPARRQDQTTGCLGLFFPLGLLNSNQFPPGRSDLPSQGFQGEDGSIYILQVWLLLHVQVTGFSNQGLFFSATLNMTATPGPCELVITEHHTQEPGWLSG